MYGLIDLKGQQLRIRICFALYYNVDISTTSLPELVNLGELKHLLLPHTFVQAEYFRTQFSRGLVRALRQEVVHVRYPHIFHRVPLHLGLVPLFDGTQRLLELKVLDQPLYPVVQIVRAGHDYVLGHDDEKPVLFWQHVEVVVVDVVLLVAPQRKAVGTDLGVVVVPVFNYIQLRAQGFLVFVQFLGEAQQDELVVQRCYPAYVKFGSERWHWKRREFISRPVVELGSFTWIDEVLG